MAYDQHSNYQQPPPRQYYNQGPPQGRPPAGYNNQYNSYDDYDGYDGYDGYNQGQDDRWNNEYQQGYADPRQGAGWGNANMDGQRPPPQRQQYQGGYDMNGQPRSPPQNQGYNAPQGRMPPPRESQFRPGPMSNEQPPYKGQPRGYEQRSRPMEPNGLVDGGMQRGNSRGPSNGGGQNPQNIQQPQKTPGTKLN